MRFIIYILLAIFSLGCVSTPNVQVQGIEVSNSNARSIKRHQDGATGMMIIGGVITASGMLSLQVIEDKGDEALAYPIIMGGAGASLILAGIIYYYAVE